MSEDTSEVNLVGEVRELGRAQRETNARLTLVEETLAITAASARVALQTATDLERFIGDVSSAINRRLDQLESAIGTNNEAHAEALAATLVETRKQTPLLRGVQDRTARSAAWASAFGTGFVYALAELIRRFWH